MKFRMLLLALALVVGPALAVAADPAAHGGAHADAHGQAPAAAAAQQAGHGSDAGGAGGAGGVPAVCESLKDVHGATTMNNFFMATSSVHPDMSAVEMCKDALQCKRLLRPLMTPDERFQRPCLNDCSHKGMCEAGECKCMPGFAGPDCSTALCKDECNKQGLCVFGECKCDPGFEGDSCERVQECPWFNDKECGGHGWCKHGHCHCHPGHEGEACEFVSPCPGDCSSVGFCMYGACFCPAGVGGDDCSVSAHGSGHCGEGCGDHGECDRGVCRCEVGYKGRSCEIVEECPRAANGKQCGGHGVCHAGKCACDEGHEGSTCSAISACPLNEVTGLACSGAGLCHKGRCYCHPGSEGHDCRLPSECPAGCNENGVCIEGKCKCMPGWKGEDCAIATGPASAVNSHSGDCGNSTSDRTFSRAELRHLLEGDVDCPSACSGVGVCLNGTCACIPGFTGADCSLPAFELRCPEQCNFRGVCQYGKCQCMDSYTGPSCAHSVEPSVPVTECPKACSAHGSCNADKTCSCEPGYAGAACEVELPCEDNCSGQGVCDRGSCLCFPGFEGPSCARPARCLDGCNGKGLCYYGKCFCQAFYEGEACERSPACREGCDLESGWCIGTDSCACAPGFHGPDCGSKLKCPNDCGGPTHGRCTMLASGPKCHCNENWSGEDCTRPNTCPDDCSNRGLCLAGKCQCDQGYAGAACETRVGGDSMAETLGGHDEEKTGQHTSTTGGGAHAEDEKAKGASTPQQPRFRESLQTAVVNGVASSKTTTGDDHDHQRQEEARPEETSVRERQPEDLPAAPAAAAAADFSAKSDAGVVGEGGRLGKSEAAAALRFRAVLHAAALAKSDGDAVEGGDGLCPNDCSGQGVCANSVCFCHPGHTGEDCAVDVVCENDCSGQGICKYGMCWCNPRFEGSDCSVAAGAGGAEEPKKSVPQVWITVILCLLTFIGGFVIGRKTLARSAMKFIEFK